MIVSRFCSLLHQGGFTCLRGECAEITYWYRVYDDSVFYFHVCDFTNGVFISENDLMNSLQRVRNEFYVRGYRNIEKLSVVFAYDITAAKHVFAYDMAHWFVELADKRLLIYEAQPDDFMGWRQKLELFLENEKVLKNTKKKESIRNLSAVNTVIVLLNVIVFLVTEIRGDTLDAYYMYECGAMYGPAIKDEHEFYRLFTSMFLHFGLSHLSGNMIVLLLLGDNLERALGKIRYVLIYILSGLCAGGCSYIYNIAKGSNAVCAGASGAIFGVIGALLYIVLANKGKLEDLTGTRLLILVGYTLYTGFTSSGIDNAAHIGGLLAGFLMGVVLYRKKKEITA